MSFLRSIRSKGNRGVDQVEALSFSRTGPTIIHISQENGKDGRSVSLAIYRWWKGPRRLVLPQKEYPRLVWKL